MNRTLFVHHHLGMGDHIICNGLIRSLLGTNSSFQSIAVFAKEGNHKRVQRMFDDDSRIMVISVPSDANEVLYVNSVVEQYKICDFIRCGFGIGENLESMGVVSNFDEGFYACAGIPFDHRWTRFRLRRNRESEQEALKRLNPTGQPFVFVHDDPSRGFILNPETPKELAVIKNDPSIDMFDMISLLENASEIHCMESSFRCLIEHIDTIVCPLYLHTSVRPERRMGNFVLSSSKKNWIRS